MARASHFRTLRGLAPSKSTNADEPNTSLGVYCEGLVDAKYVKDFVVWVRFDGGVEGEIDLKPELYGSVLEPLLDPAEFRKF
jgi:hypothetical protein